MYLINNICTLCTQNTLKYKYIKNKQEKSKLKYTCSLNESAQKEPDWNT